MKKRKSTVSVLLFLCIIVWGTIGWKVYSTLTESPSPVAPVAKPVLAVKEDNIRLLLNYRDPFLDDFLLADNSEAQTLQEPSFENQEPDVVFTEEIVPDFQYKGTIRIGSVSQAMVTRQNENTLLKVHDKIGDFVVLKITEEVLTVSRAGKKHQLSME